MAQSVEAADAPVVAISGGGKVTMTNTINGTITGRVAFDASAAGNEFTNAGQIVGGVSLGAGKGANRFNAITGSWVTKGAGTAPAISVQNSTMEFAAAGVVDGGAGGGNTLALQNAIGGGTGTAGLGTVANANYVNFSNLIVNSGTWNLAGPVLTGAATTTQLNGGVLTVDHSDGLGAGTVTGNGGTLQAGRVTLALNNAVVLGTNGLTVSGDNALILNGELSGAGKLTKTGAGSLVLNGDNTYAGITTVSGGTLQLGTLSTTGSLGTGAVVNDGLVYLARSNDMTLSNAFSGTGRILQNGSGVVSLVGDSSAFAGSTDVSKGGLTVSNKLGGTVAAFSGTTLAGSGTIGGDVGVTGGVLQGTQGQTLTIRGDLTLTNAQVNVAVGAPGPAAALFDVGGELTLTNSTLNVSDMGGLGTGVYRLFNYGKSLTGSSLGFGSMPAGVGAGSLTLQFLTGKVNLVSTVGTVFDYWDGNTAGTHANGAVNGGSGVWNTANSNWTTSDGASNGAFKTPSLATFKGTAGVVTVDATAGAIGVKGMTIGTDGYVIQGDSIALQGGSQTTIGVGNGTAASSNFIGTITASLTGASKLYKTDYGTLVLGGDNTYAGGTDIQFGTLSVSADNNLGAANTDVAMIGGTLATTASFDTNRHIALTQDGAINVATGMQLGLTGTVHQHLRQHACASRHPHR
ncbi:hypothetical protein G6F35_007406 [Rhizopus arrhizus]|nr:hypothetical protein G6F35_007406 [Rhizopus arrhizus]